MPALVLWGRLPDGDFGSFQGNFRDVLRSSFFRVARSAIYALFDVSLSMRFEAFLLTWVTWSLLDATSLAWRAKFLLGSCADGSIAKHDNTITSFISLFMADTVPLSPIVRIDMLFLLAIAFVATNERE